MDIEKLILGVFERKALWDQTNKDYHNRDMARKMWLSLAQEINETSKYMYTTLLFKKVKHLHN